MKILQHVDENKDHLPDSKQQGPGVTYEWDLFMSDSGGGGRAC